MIFKRLIFCITSLFTLLAFAGPVSATIVSFFLEDAVRTTGWRMEYDDTKVQNPIFTGIATGRLQGTLQIDKVFKSMAPIDIEFIELAAASGNSFGLRITLNENVHNQSTFNWSGFNMRLIDDNPVLQRTDNTDQSTFNNNVSGDHPGFAHFHGDAAGVFNTPPFSTIGGGESEKFLTLGKGTFPDSSARAWSGIGIHQIEQNLKQRDFILRETPIPEPNALALLAIGLAFLRLPVWRSRAGGA